MGCSSSTKKGQDNLNNDQEPKKELVKVSWGKDPSCAEQGPIDKVLHGDPTLIRAPTSLIVHSTTYHRPRWEIEEEKDAAKRKATKKLAAEKEAAEREAAKKESIKDKGAHGSAHKGSFRCCCCGQAEESGFSEAGNEQGEVTDTFSVKDEAALDKKFVNKSTAATTRDEPVLDKNLVNKSKAATIRDEPKVEAFKSMSGSRMGKSRPPVGEKDYGFRRQWEEKKAGEKPRSTNSLLSDLALDPKQQQQVRPLQRAPGTRPQPRGPAAKLMKKVRIGTGIGGRQTWQQPQGQTGGKPAKNVVRRTNNAALDIAASTQQVFANGIKRAQPLPPRGPSMTSTQSRKAQRSDLSLNARDNVTRRTSDKSLPIGGQLQMNAPEQVPKARQQQQPAVAAGSHFNPQGKNTKTVSRRSDLSLASRPPERHRTSDQSLPLAPFAIESNQPPLALYILPTDGRKRHRNDLSYAYRYKENAKNDVSFDMRQKIALELENEHKIRRHQDQANARGTEGMDRKRQQATSDRALILVRPPEKRLSDVSQNIPVTVERKGAEIEQDQRMRKNVFSYADPKRSNASLTKGNPPKPTGQQQLETTFRKEKSRDIDNDWHRNSADDQSMKTAGGEPSCSDSTLPTGERRPPREANNASLHESQPQTGHAVVTRTSFCPHAQS